MFGKLKEKLKSWFKSSSEKVEETAEKQEIIDVKLPVKEIKEKVKETPKKQKEEKISKKQKKEVEKRKEKISPTKEEIKPGVVESIQETDAIEVLSQQPREKILAVLEEGRKESTKETDERIEYVKEEEIKEFEEEIEKAKKEKIKEAPLEFSVAKEKYEPDLEKIKEETEQEIQPPEKKQGFFSRLKASFTYKISENEFNDIFDDLEMLLLENNVALEVVEDLKKRLAKQLIGKEIKKDELEKEINNSLKRALQELIIEPDDPLDILKISRKEKKEPFVILFFGINGTGKTTSIAKLANLFQKNNYSVLLAAADTFRAASIEQIQEHADKLKIHLIKHDYGADPSAVGFDAIKYAKNHKIDIVLIDTAGRMHTKSNLLQEMEKIVRVTKPDLKIFVAESIAGNDATEQARAFHEMVGIDGSILSKADIDEKGGTILSVSHVTHKPIFYLGTGQEYKDIKLFNKQDFIQQLLG